MRGAVAGADRTGERGPDAAGEGIGEINEVTAADDGGEKQRHVRPGGAARDREKLAELEEGQAARGVGAGGPFGGVGGTVVVAVRGAIVHADDERRRFLTVRDAVAIGVEDGCRDGGDIGKGGGARGGSAHPIVIGGGGSQAGVLIGRLPGGEGEGLQGGGEIGAGAALEGKGGFGAAVVRPEEVHGARRGGVGGEAGGCGGRGSGGGDQDVVDAGVFKAGAALVDAESPVGDGHGLRLPDILPGGEALRAPEADPFHVDRVGGGLVAIADGDRHVVGSVGHGDLPDAA